MDLPSVFISPSLSSVTSTGKKEKRREGRRDGRTERKEKEMEINKVFVDDKQLTYGTGSDS